MPSVYSILSLRHHWRTLHDCILYALGHKRQNSGQITLECLQLAGKKKEITLVQHSQHFLICCTNENMYRLWISSFVFSMRALVKRTVDFYQPAQHSSSVMYNIFNRAGPCTITSLMLKPAVRFRKGKGKPFCFLTFPSTPIKGQRPFGSL